MQTNHAYLKNLFLTKDIMILYEDFSSKLKIKFIAYLNLIHILCYLLMIVKKLLRYNFKRKDNMQTNLPIILKNVDILLIGAGKIAKQKYITLKESHFSPTVMAAEIHDDYFLSIFIKKVLVKKSNFKKNIKGYHVIINATGDKRLSKMLFKYRHKYGYLLNCVDMPEYCDFYFGAIARFGDISVTVSTSGASPLLAQKIRDKIARFLPRSLSTLIDSLKKERQNNKETYIQKASSAEKLGKVFIIGCGPNGPQNLTLKALETLEIIDIAFVDNLVGIGIWNILRDMGCEIKSVAKQKGVQRFTQAQINEMMLQAAQEGKCVGRIKGGDPAVFGRVWEEVSFLEQNNITVEVISGITSSLHGALSSGIAPTIRGVSSGIIIVSAHLRESIFNSQWLELVRYGEYTVIVLMAYSFLEKIAHNAQKKGIYMKTPAALISRIDTQEQKTIIGNLQNLPDMASLCEQPAILIIGNSIKHILQHTYTGERIYKT